MGYVVPKIIRKWIVQYEFYQKKRLIDVLIIRDESDFYRCLDYVYYNPVKHGYVNSPYDWAYSTFKRDVTQGLYEIDWGSHAELSKIKDLEFE